MKKDILLFLLSMGILVYLFLGSGLLDPPELYLDTFATPTSESDGSPPLIIVIVPYRSPTPTINYSLPTQRPTYTPFATYTPGPTTTPRPTRTPTSTPFPPQPFVVGPQARSTQIPPERCPVPAAGEAPPPPFYLGYDPGANSDSDDFEFPTREAALEYLNKYGIAPVRTKIETIAAQRRWKAEWLREKFFMQDLTNDGVPEIMMTLQVSFPYEPFIIIGCRQGKYVLLYEQDNVDGYLAAYARFRLMLLHLLRGWEPEAQIAYNELQKRFPEGQPGGDFAAMGAAFWARFQESRDLAVACSAAREYITAHPEGLYFVGSDHHGWQGFGYTAGSLCPVE